jgi:hypothetical protein
MSRRDPAVPGSARRLTLRARETELRTIEYLPSTGWLRRAAPPQALPVMDWARAYGLTRDPGSGRHAISLIGPGPGFDPGYAMTASLDVPLIIATLTTADGEPAGPLLVYGYALTDTVH